MSWAVWDGSSASEGATEDAGQRVGPTQDRFDISDADVPDTHHRTETAEEAIESLGIVPVYENEISFEFSSLGL